MDTKLITASVLSLAFIGVSCSTRQGKIPIQTPEAPHATDSVTFAYERIGLGFFAKALSANSGNVRNLDSALLFFNKAINCDSLYMSAYVNKAKTLQKKGLLLEAISVLDSALKIRPSFIELAWIQGVLYEKAGDAEHAGKKYIQALKGYRNRLESDSLSIDSKRGIAMMYLFLYDKKKATREMRKLILEYPDDALSAELLGLFENFDKARFIDDF